VRILQCIESLQSGGAERQLCYLAEGLVRHGLEVDVAYFGRGPYEQPLRAAGVALHRLDGASAAMQLVALHRSMRMRCPDVVQTWLGRMNVLGGVASRSLGRPWIYCERSVRLHDRGLPGALRQWLGARSSLLVANSEAGARRWRPLGRPVQVVPNGLPVDEIAATPAAMRATLGVDAQAELIVYAGRFVLAKNIARLAEALVRLLAARPRAVALCCGEGALLPAFRAKVARDGVGARCFTPGYRNDLWALLKSADAFVLPSLAEGQPNVVLEAMAAGCPVAISDIEAHREIATRETGIFFSPDSVDDAVAALNHILDDKPAAQKRAAAARAWVRRRSLDAMVRTYIALYQQLLENA
jgi:glycosyltransferase involved in cell wall biosynthesis